MDADLARRAHALFTRAMDLEPQARREFAEHECAGQPALLQRVLALLEAADRSEAFLDRPALDGDGRESAPLPDAVGNYLVVGVLGAGGMATVYEAIQESPKRRVALKVLNQRMTSADAYLRFRFETEALARLHHPGIAQIYEAGAAQLHHDSPAPFFAMELVEDAAPIDEYAERRALSLRDRVAMFASVCDAVHHGHQRGVIHRDIKPGNVLVDREGRAKVIDFGVARTTEDGAERLTSLADARQLIGTLNYMSPEQCGAPAEVDIRTDVYSLGVLLYQIVCGRLPHDLADLPLPAALHRIINDPPRRPGLPPSRAHRDIEAIILKAIEKQPDRRYESAAALAADLRRSLHFQAIEARPPGLVDHVRLFTRRHRALVAASVSLLVGVVLVAAVSTAFAVRLAEEVDRRREAEQLATRERDVARGEAYTARIAGALAAMNTGEFQQMRARLAAAANQPRRWEWGFLSRLAERSAGALVGHDAMILDLAADAPQARYATAASDGSVRLWDLETASPIATFESDSAERMLAVGFTMDGRFVVCGDERGVVRLLENDTLREVEVIADLDGAAAGVAGLPGDRVAIAAGGAAWIWSQPRRTLTPAPDDQPGGVRGLAASPDGLALATYNNDGAVWVRDATDLSVLRRLEFPGGVNQVRFSADGRRLAAVGASGVVLVWDLDDGSVLHRLQATTGVNTVQSVAFSNDGALLAVGLVHRGILVYDLHDGALAGEFGGHTDSVSGLRFRPDDQQLISASWDRSIRSWRLSELAAPGGISILDGHRGYVRSVAFSPDGAMVISASHDGDLRLWDPDLASPVARVPVGAGALYAMDLSPDGRSIACGGSDGAVRIVHADTGAVAETLRGDGGAVATVAFDPDGRRIAAGFQDGSIRLWSRDADEPPLVLTGHAARVNSVRFSPDGAVIASGSRDGSVRLWDAAGGRETGRFDDHLSDVFVVLFSPNGRRLYSGSRDQSVRVWDLPSRAPIATLEGHGQYVTCLALSPDGTRLAAGSWFGSIVLFDVESFEQVASFPAHGAAIRGVAFSPDGRWLASCSYDSTVQLYDSRARDAADAARARAADARDAARRRIEPFLSHSRADAAAAQRALADADLDPLAEPWLRKAVLEALLPPEPGP